MNKKGAKIMKKFAKVLALALATVMTVGTLASCSSGDLGFKNGTYKIGSSGPLTGENASYGESVRNGAIIAIEEINANGGLNGVKFSFDMKNDECDGTKASNNYTALYEAGMQASIGAVTSGACKEFATAAAGDNVISLTPSASADNVIGVGSNSFRVCFGDPQQGEVAANELAEQYTKIGVIYDASTDYSKGIFQAFVAQMAALDKADAYVTKTFDTDNKTDFTQQVTDLKNAGCDVIFLPIYYTEASLIAKKAASLSFNVPIFGCDGLDGIADYIDASVTAEISYCTPFDANSTDTAVKKFVDAYKAKFNATPDQFAADGYDAVMILFKAMQTAGVNDVNISASDLCNAITAVLTNGSFTYTGATGSDMSWSADGSCTKKASVVVVEH